MKSGNNNTNASTSMALQTKSKEEDYTVGGTISTKIGNTLENSVILQHNHEIKRDVFSKSTLDVTDFYS